MEYFCQEETERRAPMIKILLFVFVANILQVSKQLLEFFFAPVNDETHLFNFVNLPQISLSFCEAGWWYD